MNYICLDLEMNQPSNKIIQLGYVIFNPLTSEVKRERSIIINPYDKLSEYIIELTGIDQLQVDNGTPLIDAVNMLKKDLEHYNVRLQPLEWGSGDSHLLQQQSGEDLFRSPVNVKALYQTYALFNSMNMVAGLRKSLKYMGMEFVGRPHDALDDARNTMLIYLEIGKKLKLASDLIKIIDRSKNG